MLNFCHCHRQLMVVALMINWYITSKYLWEGGGGGMDKCLEYQTLNLEVAGREFLFWSPVGVFLGSPVFNSLAILVISQLVFSHHFKILNVLCSLALFVSLFVSFVPGKPHCGGGQLKVLIFYLLFTYLQNITALLYYDYAGLSRSSIKKTQLA